MIKKKAASRIRLQETTAISVRLKDLAFGGMMKVSALKKEC